MIIASQTGDAARKKIATLSAKLFPVGLLVHDGSNICVFLRELFSPKEPDELVRKRLVRAVSVLHWFEEPLASDLAEEIVLALSKIGLKSFTDLAAFRDLDLLDSTIRESISMPKDAATALSSCIRRCLSEDFFIAGQ